MGLTLPDEEAPVVAHVHDVVGIRIRRFQQLESVRFRPDCGLLGHPGCGCVASDDQAVCADEYRFKAPSKRGAEILNLRLGEGERGEEYGERSKRVSFHGLAGSRERKLFELIHAMGRNPDFTPSTH